MTEPRDPVQMHPRDRLAELADILARGYVRLLAARQKALAESAESEPSCVHVVDSPTNSGRKEMP